MSFRSTLGGYSRQTLSAGFYLQDFLPDGNLGHRADEVLLQHLTSRLVRPVFFQVYARPFPERRHFLRPANQIQLYGLSGLGDGNFSLPLRVC